VVFIFACLYLYACRNVISLWGLNKVFLFYYGWTHIDNIQHLNTCWVVLIDVIKLQTFEKIHIILFY